MIKISRLYMPILLVIIGFSAVNAGVKNDSIVDYVKCSPLRADTIKNYFRTHGIDESFVDTMTNKGYYLPNDTTCAYTAPVFAPMHFKFANISNSLLQTDVLSALYQLTDVLYRLIPETNGVPDKPYDFTKLNQKQVFDSLQLGAWAFICDGHSKTAEYFINSYSKGRFTTKVLTLNPDSGDVVSHVVLAVYYLRNNEWYGITLDCQNGEIGPVTSDATDIASIKQLKEALPSHNANKQFTMLALQDYSLRQKRTLIDRPMPCNYYPDKASKYYKAYPESGMAYERLSYSELGLMWFKNKSIDLDAYTYDLIKALVVNVPTLNSNPTTKTTVEKAPVRTPDNTKSAKTNSNNNKIK